MNIKTYLCAQKVKLYFRAVDDLIDEIKEEKKGNYVYKDREKSVYKSLRQNHAWRHVNRVHWYTNHPRRTLMYGKLTLYCLGVPAATAARC